MDGDRFKQNVVTTATIKAACSNNDDHVSITMVATVDDTDNEPIEHGEYDVPDVQWLSEWIAQDPPADCPVCEADLSISMSWPGFRAPPIDLDAVLSSD